LSKLGEPDAFSSIQLSPDGKRALLSLLDADGRPSDLWQIDVARGNRSRLTFDPQSDSEGVWSPDGHRIVFASNRGNGRSNLYLTSDNASGNDQPLDTVLADEIPTSWSRDGQNILIMRWSDGRAGIWVLRPGVDTEAKQLLHSTAFDQTAGTFSPNGRFFAYTTNESGTSEVYVQSFPLSANKWPVSSGGGALPLWREGGRELFYVTPDARVMSVEVKTDGAFESGTPKELFQTKLQHGSGIPYAVTPDGSRFLIETPAEETSTPVVVLLNWSARLKHPS
jgi:Tol biopolymer transport system component